MQKCYSEKATDSNVTPIEKALNIKGYSKAVKNRKLIGLQWFKDRGFVILPTNKIPRRGYVVREDRTFEIDKEIKDKNLSMACREAVQLSTTDIKKSLPECDQLAVWFFLYSEYYRYCMGSNTRGKGDKWEYYWAGVI